MILQDGGTVEVELPAGGSVDILVPNFVPTGAKIPAGGDLGEVLTKVGVEDYAVDWQPPPEGGGGGGGVRRGRCRRPDRTHRSDHPRQLPIPPPRVRRHPVARAPVRERNHLMSLATQITNLATRIATEVKAIRVLVNGNAADLSSLTTSSKTTIVAAINEVKALTDAAAASGGATNLDQLTDVVSTSPVTGHVLRHNGTQFVNVLGTTHFEVAGAAAAAESAAIAASQPRDTDLTAIAALTTTAYGRALLALADQAALMGLMQAASATVQGKVELATDAEAVTGTDPARATTPANVAAVFADRIDTNVALGASNTKVPSQAAVKAYADALIGANDAMVFKGVLDASANPNYPAGNRGDTYRISVAGKVGGASGPAVEPGDLLIATADGSGAGTQATVGANWTIVQANLDGAVTGPASSVSGNLTSFSGTGGKVVADSGFSVDNGTVNTGSAVKIPTQNAVKAYAQPVDADLTAIAALASAANKMPYATGAGAWALADLSAFARTLLDDADAATARSTLSVYSQAELGNPETDFVATFNAGLV